MNIYQQLKKLFSVLWKHTVHKKKFVLMLFFSFISKLLWFIEPWILGQLFNRIQAIGKDIVNELWYRGGLLVFIPLISRLFHGIARIREQVMIIETVQRYRSHLFSIASGLQMQRHQDNHSGSVIDKITKACSALENFGQNIFNYMFTVVNLFGSLVVLSYIRPQIILYLLVILIIIGVIVRRFDTRLIAIQKQKNTVSHKINALLFDYLSNIKTLITLRFQKRAQYELESVMSQLIPLEVSYARYNEGKRGLMDTIIGTVVVCMMMLYIFGQYQKKGVLAIGDLTIIFGYMQKLRHAFDNITRYYGELIKQGTDLHAVDDLIQEYSKEHQNSLENMNSKQHRSELTISNLNFSYKSSEHTSQTLQNISLQIISGQKIAFVGASGSGKSTMLALLRGLYPVDNVSLRLDEIHYDSLHSITEHTSLIPQDPEIFENTMRYNITCGLEVSDESILQYCRMARFDEVLDQLPNGLNTDIKEKGVNLSGGQKQRLALARGLLLSSDSDILLLDEPTSSVDATNEKIIFTNILQFFDKRTIIAVMHRLHLLQMFDYIYVFDQGKIIESGTFQHLIQSKGSFYTMRQEYSLQEHTL